MREERKYMPKLEKGSQQLIIGIVVLVLVVAGAWYYFSQDGEEGDSMISEGAEMMMKDETARLNAVGNYSGSGTATRSYDGESFSHSVIAILGSPSEGKFYEGWLVKKTPELTLVSTGKLTQDGETFVLTFNSGQNYTDYKDIVVTEETASLGLDGNPEAHVLEGSF